MQMNGNNLPTIIRHYPAPGYYDASEAGGFRVHQASSPILESVRNVYTPYYDPRWRTTALLSHKSFDAQGRLKPTVVGSLLLLPGAGCAHSTVSAMIQTGEMFRRLKNPEDQPLYAPNVNDQVTLAILSVNQPGQPDSPDPKDFEQLSDYLDWVRSIVFWMRTWGVPVIGVGRSAGANIFLEYAHRFSPSEGMLEGAVFMSGYRASWSPHAIRYILNQPHFDISYPSLWWALSYDGTDAPPNDFFNAPRHLFERVTLPLHPPQWGWQHAFTHIGSPVFSHEEASETSGLILYGENDAEYPRPEAGLFWKTYAEMTGYELFLNPDAGHDHFQRTRTPLPAIQQSTRVVRRYLLERIQHFRNQRGLGSLSPERNMT